MPLRNYLILSVGNTDTAIIDTKNSGKNCNLDNTNKAAFGV